MNRFHGAERAAGPRAKRCCRTTGRNPLPLVAGILAERTSFFWFVIQRETTSEVFSGYAKRVRRYAEIMEVDVIFADEWVWHERGTGPDGRKRYTVADGHQHADFITYPSTYEGFVNAFLEAVYYRKPILCNRYAIYRPTSSPVASK